MGDAAISTWTTFKVATSQPIDPSKFKTLSQVKKDFHKASYGRITESPSECLLVIDWKTNSAYDTFKNSPLYQEFISDLRGGDLTSTEPETQAVDFGKTAFTWRFGPRTEIFTVYFPDPVSPETRATMEGMKGLTLTVGLGIDGSRAHLSPYRGVPCYGWAVGSQSWRGSTVGACVWCHYWKDAEAEAKYKTTERRMPRDGETERPLAVDVFQQSLTEMGAIGWDEKHVDFVEVPETL